MSNIDFSLQSIGGLISAGRLRVPRNQRDYSWEVEHALDLCNDIGEALRTSKPSYFLGTIVLTTSRGQVLEVVDGPPEASKAFNLFVNWIVRLFIAGAGRIGRVEAVYAKLAHAIHHNRNARTVTYLVKEMKSYLPTDEEFRQAFAVARVSQAKLARYYLDALQRKQDKEDDKPELVPNDDTSQVNLEHVIPLTCRKDHWPDLERDVAEVLYGRLGNMALLNAKKNSMIGAHSFDEKKDTLAASPFSFTNMIAKKANWGPQEVAERQQLLAKLAVKTWPLRVD